jgi:hypothetical protein
MKKSWDLVAAYVAADAANRNGKGYSLGRLSARDVLAYAAEELRELEGAPHDVEEMADLFGCLLHYCQKMGWTLPTVEAVLAEKLRLRFGPPPAPPRQASSRPPYHKRERLTLSDPDVGGPPPEESWDNTAVPPGDRSGT